MIIRGILDNSLNGQLCIRGFAPIKELARISKADYSYQRNLIDRLDIIDFLEKQTYLFFPELILSYKIKHSFDKNNSGLTPLEAISLGKSYKSSVDNTQIKIKNIPFKENQDLRGKTSLSVVDLVFDDSYLNELIRLEKPPLHRIDGNHRLDAAEASTSSKVEQMVAPFCIIIGVEYYQNNEVQKLDDSKAFEKSTKVFFYNINTKTIPLTSEENLKVLIDDDVYFLDDELKDIFGGVYPIKTRKLIKKAEPNYFTGIEHIIKDQYRTYYNDIFYRLLEKGEDPGTIVDKVFESLKAIDQLYKTESKLKTNSCFGLLTAFLYYHIESNNAKFNQFKNWIFNNHLFEVDELKAESIIKIFDKISEQEIKVFVAMPYFQGKPEIVRDYNVIYDSVISDIRNKYSIKISLFPIMENKGETQDQIQDIINKIKQCSIFIADISDNNANVMYEAGWARALDKHVLLFREAKSAQPKSDYANDTYHEYSNDARSITLSKIAKENLLEILNKNFGLIHE